MKTTLRSLRQSVLQQSSKDNRLIRSTMVPQLFFRHYFRPVGQGLFSHGDLFSPKHSELLHDVKPLPPRFDWVYDCGAEKLSPHLAQEISNYRIYHSGEIDLLIFSHFDRDHVLGIRELLMAKKTKVVVLPYLFLAERLASISRLEPADLETARFLYAPAATLRELCGDGTRIVFVLPGGNPPPEESDGDSADPDQPWPPEPAPNSSPANPARQLVDPAFDPDLAGANIFYIDGSLPFVVKGLWEFCFYNRPRPEMKVTLQRLLKPALERFVKTNKTADDYVAFIANLKLVFEAARGPGKKPRRFDANEISLVVYSGPTRRSEQNCFRGGVPSIIPASSNHALVDRLYPTSWPVTTGRCSTLFTGDIKLDDPTFEKVTRHLGKGRIAFVAYFQVPHHGSRHSFKLTNAVAFQPDYSIISSARHHSRYRHPSSDVLDALRTSGLLLVNEFQGLATGGILTRPQSS